MIDRQVILSALRSLESLQTVLEDGLEGGVVAPHYLREKLDTLEMHVRCMGAVPDTVRPKQKGDAR